MNKKLNLLVMLVSLLALSLVFGSCDNGTTDNGGGTDGAKTFTLTGITDIQKAQGQTFVLFGLFPGGTDEATVKSDAAAFFANTQPSAVVAYMGGSTPTITGSTDNWTISATLNDASTGGTWSGSGTYDAWFCLRNSSNQWTGYKKTGLSITGSITTCTASEFGPPVFTGYTVP
jgi:hypothetical protein